MGAKYPIIVIDHEDGEVVYCWGREMGTETVGHCLRVHPEEPITVRTIRMTEKQYEALSDYQGDCQ